MACFGNTLWPFAGRKAFGPEQMSADFEELGGFSQASCDGGIRHVDRWFGHAIPPPSLSVRPRMFT